MGAGNVAPAPVRATPLKLPEPLPPLLLHAAPTAITTPAATSRSMPLVLVTIPPSLVEATLWAGDVPGGSRRWTKHEQSNGMRRRAPSYAPQRSAEWI